MSGSSWEPIWGILNPFWGRLLYFLKAAQCFQSKLCTYMLADNNLTVSKVKKSL